MVRIPAGIHKKTKHTNLETTLMRLMLMKVRAIGRLLSCCKAQSFTEYSYFLFRGLKIGINRQPPVI